MHEALGPTVALIAPVDGFFLPPYAPLTQRVEQRGVYLIGADLIDPRSQLPPAGRAFAAAFGATPPVGENELWAPYAAQATDMMLAAIARSDGMRPSVVHQLFRTRVTGGILGNFTVSKSGDLAPTAVVIARSTVQPPGSTPVTTIRLPPNTR